MYWLGHDRSQERLASAKQAVSKAVQLNPALPEASLALGHYYYHGHSDYDRALEYLAEARKGRPNDSELLAWIGYVQRRQGKFEQAIENITSAFELDPRSNFLAFNIGLAAVLLRNYSEAERYYEQAISLAPDIESLYLAKARLYMLREGSTEKARAVVNDLLENIDATQSPAISNFLVMADIYDGNYQEALDRLSSKSTDPNSPDLTTVLQHAQLYRYMDQKELAQGYYESARDILETRVKEQPQDAEVRAALGIVYAGLGRKQDATREGKLALELLPVAKDALRGPPLVEQLARIYVMVNEYDLAVEQLEYLLSIPSELSISLLQLDPAWGLLRDHPRFKNLLEAGK
jgi:serine/threonine-protein kinase